MATRIIRIPRTDTTSPETAFILGEVGPPGSKPLNVKVVATEGDCPYVVKCKFLPFSIRYPPAVAFTTRLDPPTGVEHVIHLV
jgi:hypothetical protein